jgi:hypothetical protein
MVTWAAFKATNPDLAAAGERLFRRGDQDEALLATVRADEPPRIHPISIGIVGSGLYAFILRSPKRVDLEEDGRFALHAHQDPAAPSEFSVRGRARLIEAEDVRREVASGWSFDVDESYHLFEFGIESALLGSRNGPDEWPPIYSSWAA